MFVSVPLRGLGWEIGRKRRRGRKKRPMVSVPLRGLGWEMRLQKCRLQAGAITVSVPLRGLGWEIVVLAFTPPKGCKDAFPSPCGGWVGKSYCLCWPRGCANSGRVSVPLRGLGWEIELVVSGSRVKEPVSVPLRGLGWEIQRTGTKPVNW